MLSSRQLGERVLDARKTAGLTQAEVAAKIEISRTTLVAVEKGERRPSNEELVRLAEVLQTSVHDLLREHRPVAAVSPRFRVHFGEDREGPGVLAAVKRLRILAAQYIELELLAGVRRAAARLELVRRYNVAFAGLGLEPDVAGRDAAATVRGLLGAGDAPFFDLEERLEAEAGLRVFYLERLPSRLSAFFIWGDDIGACVGVNRAHPFERQRWSLGHEFGHFLRDREAGDVYDEVHVSRDPEEVFAEAFTAELLLPEVGVRIQFADRCRASSRFSAVELLSLAHYFQVSFEAMCRRLEELKLLPLGTYVKLVASGVRPGDIERRATSRAATPSLHRRLGVPQRYLALAIAVLGRDEISEREFADFLGVDRVAARGVYQEATGLAMEDGSLIDAPASMEDLRAS